MQTTPMLKIGLVCFAWGKEHRGGLETHVSGIAHQLSARGHRLFLHCVNTAAGSTPFSTRSWQEGPIHVQEMACNHAATGDLLDFQRVPQAETILESWVRHHQLDVVDVHHTLFFGMRALKTLSAQVPTIATLHDYWCLDPRGQLLSPEGQILQPGDEAAWEASVRFTWPMHTAKSCLLYTSPSPRD